MTRLTQPLKWHGGKHYLAKRIIERFPPHTHYVEPYAGGLAVLIAKPAEWIEGHSEVVNDTNGCLINFWMSIRECLPQMQRELQTLPFSERLFEFEARNPYTPIDSPDWRAACAFFLRYRQSRQGLGRDFATLSRNRTRRGMNEQVSSWLTAIDGLPAMHERLKRVVILNRDALDVIRSQDGPNTFFYLDPPYMAETRTSQGEYGEHEMTPQQHDELLELLSTVAGKFLLSGYPSPLYDQWSHDVGWHCDRIEIDNKASSAKTKPRKTECLWSNF